MLAFDFFFYTLFGLIRWSLFSEASIQACIVFRSSIFMLCHRYFAVFFTGTCLYTLLALSFFEFFSLPASFVPIPDAFPGPRPFFMCLFCIPRVFSAILCRCPQEVKWFITFLILLNIPACFLSPLWLLAYLTFARLLAILVSFFHGEMSVAIPSLKCGSQACVLLWRIVMTAIACAPTVRSCNVPPLAATLKPQTPDFEVRMRVCFSFFRVRSFEFPPSSPVHYVSPESFPISVVEGGFIGVFVLLLFLAFACRCRLFSWWYGGFPPPLPCCSLVLFSRLSGPGLLSVRFVFSDFWIFFPSRASGFLLFCRILAFPVSELRTVLFVVRLDSCFIKPPPSPADLTRWFFSSLCSSFLSMAYRVVIALVSYPWFLLAKPRSSAFPGLPILSHRHLECCVLFPPPRYFA